MGVDYYAKIKFFDAEDRLVKKMRMIWDGQCVLPANAVRFELEIFCDHDNDADESYGDDDDDKSFSYDDDNSETENNEKVKQDEKEKSKDKNNEAEQELNNDASNIRDNVDTDRME